MAQRIKAVVSARLLYPWSRWADGGSYRVRQGKEFKCEPRSFRSALYVHAGRAGLSVTTAIKGNAVEFQFSK